MDADYRPLDAATVTDVVCCPGGLELEEVRLRGDLSEVASWRRRMVACGMGGVVAYAGGRARGFAEYMPAERAPLPIEAPGAAVLMCYHWAGTNADDPEHLVRERDLIGQVVRATRGRFSGLATQGWAVPTHFPIALLEELGFRVVARHDAIALMWLPYRRGAQEPKLASAAYVPSDLTAQGRVAVDAAFSARCPYSIDFETHLKAVVAGHPRTDRIRLEMHRIDTRRQALAYAVPPFDWSWIHLNAEPVDPFALRGDRLAEELARRVEELD